MLTMVLHWEIILFGTVKLAKNKDANKYFYFGYDISFYVLGTFSLSDGGIGKNIIIFGTNMSSSVHVNSVHDILIPGKGPRQG